MYAGYGDDLIYARDTDGVDFIDCGPGFDKVETIHRDDVTLSNCERASALAGVTSKCPRTPAGSPNERSWPK